MEKPAATQFPLQSLIATRWSPLAFIAKTIEPDKVGSLFEAARWAPSSFNEQPWSFVYATRDQTAAFETILGCLVPGNQVWAKNAGLLAISVAQLAYARNNTPNRHAWHDVGMATLNLMLEAESLGLRVHAMGGFDAQKAREQLGIPATHEPVAAIAVGYPGTLAELDPSLHDREKSPRQRKPLSAVAFPGKWGG